MLYRREHTKVDTREKYNGKTNSEIYYAHMNGYKIDLYLLKEIMWHISSTAVVPNTDAWLIF